MGYTSRRLASTRVLARSAGKTHAGCPLPVTGGLPSVRSRQSVHAVAWLSSQNVLEHQDVW
jgi:hypothetical protein